MCHNSMADGQIPIMCRLQGWVIHEGGRGCGTPDLDLRGGGGSGKTGAPMRKGSYIYHIPTLSTLDFAPEAKINWA